MVIYWVLDCFFFSSFTKQKRDINPLCSLRGWNWKNKTQLLDRRESRLCLVCVSFVSRYDWRISARVDSVEEHEIVYRFIGMVCVFVGELVSVLIVRSFVFNSTTHTSVRRDLFEVWQWRARRQNQISKTHFILGSFSILR